jgi:hypothetical protein
MKYANGNKKVFDWRLICLAALFFVSGSQAQINDFGVWGSVSIRHKFSQKFSATVEEQVRTFQNSTAIAQYFTDASVEYSLSKKFKVAAGYRFINNYQQTYYSKRHRVYADLSYKTKFRKLQVILRTRIQEQQQDIQSSETGFIPEWYSRNKLTAKLDLTRKYMPYASAEMWYLINAPNVTANYIDKWRYTFGVEYDFNREHSLDAFYLIQRDRMINQPLTYYAVGLGYVFTF